MIKTTGLLALALLDPGQAPCSWTETLLRPPVVEAYGRFGQAVARTDAWLFVGMPYFGTLGLGEQGRVDVYRREGADWVPAQALSPTNPNGRESFGFSLAADGDTLVVGAPSICCSTLTGEITVFERQGTTWSRTYFFREPLPQVDFGKSVAIDGDCIVAGGDLAPQNVVRIFERAGGSWMPTALFTASSPSGSFGASVGAGPGRAVAVDGAADRVHVYERAGSVWSEATVLDVPVPIPSGGSVALEGDELVVLVSGGFLTYVLDGGAWTLVEARRANSRVLARDGKLLATGGYGAQAALWEREPWGWKRLADLAPGLSPGSSAWGVSLALDGYELAVGDPSAQPSAAGSVSLFSPTDCP